MAKITRNIIKIDEKLCNGCGQCVPACDEGAIAIVDGKAKLVADKLCDGLGACLGECPTGALSFETREADEFDEEAIISSKPKTMILNLGTTADRTHCPSSKQTVFHRTASNANTTDQPSTLHHWPVKMHLVNPQAPFLMKAHLLLAADCTAYAYGAMHRDYIDGRVVIIGCPKFDDVQAYVDKLASIVTQNTPSSITVLRMSVQCCSGLMRAAQTALTRAESTIEIHEVIITPDGHRS